MTELKICNRRCSGVEIKHAFWLEYCHSKDRDSARFYYDVTYVDLGVLFADKLHGILGSHT